MPAVDSAFQREELPPFPSSADMQAADADNGNQLQRAEWPPSPPTSEVTRTASLPTGQRANGVQNLSTSAAILAVRQEASSTARAPEQPIRTQQDESIRNTQLRQPSAPLSPKGRSAKAMAWLQRRGKLPPMQARARVLQH